MSSQVLLGSYKCFKLYKLTSVDSMDKTTLIFSLSLYTFPFL